MTTILDIGLKTSPKTLVSKLYDTWEATISIAPRFNFTLYDVWLSFKV